MRFELTPPAPLLTDRNLIGIVRKLVSDFRATSCVTSTLIRPIITDDDQIETALTMRCHPSTVLEESLFESPAPASTGMEIERSDSTEHGRNGGESAPCHKTSRGIITCSTCVESDRQSFLAGLDLKNKILSTNIIDRLDGAGRRGLVFEALVVSPNGVSSKACSYKLLWPLRKRTLLNQAILRQRYSE